MGDAKVKRAKKVKAVIPADQRPPAIPPYEDPGWICKAADMAGGWDEAGRWWFEKESEHLRARIANWQAHPSPPEGAAGRLLQDADLMLMGLMILLENARGSE